ncbi:hypothetical protein VRU48_15085 [Pedobacter sp. KR3-3]|uniref:DUF7674 domain-containing protein n=1 Tax=Pedobacter albus TaxID=3113905 RepID=A0ABU7IAR0_9SPHI|nr:hypothetical protein [Pedobacter sp. KR3-3]MEE1946447.1 hypothetical protein [Pedobacter sp. KR3-3]
MISKKDEKTFINDLVNNFPEIKEEVLDEDIADLLSLQVGCFKRFTQNAIDLNDLITIERCFGFVDENFEQVIFKIENSLVISFLGHLDFSKNPKIEKMLSEKLKKILKALRLHESQPKDEKLKGFLKGLKD